MKKRSHYVSFVQKTLLRMKLTLFIMIFFVVHLSASVTMHGQKITIQTENETLRDVFREIERQSPYKFFYNDAFADLDKIIHISIVGKTIDETMNTLLSSSGMSFKIMDNNLVVIAPRKELQQ